MNKKRVVLSFSLVSLFLILIFSSSILARATQDDTDLEVTLHCRLDTDSSEIQSTLISPGTYSFFDEPELDTGSFSHDLAQIEVERLQMQEFNYTDSENYRYTSGVNATQGNHTLNFPHAIPEYTIAKELDTTISLNMNYSAINYSSARNFNDPLDSDDWELYDEYDTPISFIEGNYDGTASFTNMSYPANLNFNISEAANTHMSLESIVDDHLAVVNLDDDSDAGWCGFEFNFEKQLLTSGTFEYYIRTSNADLGVHMAFMNTNNPAWTSVSNFYWVIQNFKIEYWNGAGMTTIMTGIQSNHWYRIRIDFECGNGGYKGLPADRVDFYVDGVLKGDNLPFHNPCDSLGSFGMNTQTGWYDYEVQVDAFGITGLSDGYQIGDNLISSGVCYGEESSTKELFLYNSKSSQDIHVGLNDTLEIQGYLKCSNELKVKFLDDDVVVHQQAILNNDESRLINETITDSFSFDQLLFQGIHDVSDCFILENLTISGYSNLPLFENVYIANFTYTILGINHTETFECELDQLWSDYTSENGTYRYYIDSSMFSEFDRANDLTIPAQLLTIVFDLASNTGFLFSMNISWSENDWLLPTQCDLAINSNDVIDTSLNSGVVYLSTFPETLRITSDSSNILFQLNISISFTLTFDLEIITKTYLRKSFTLLSDHDIVIEKIDLPDGLELKKVYFNDNDIGINDPNTLNPEQTMTSGNIYTLEIILDDAIHERLPYISNLATDTYERLYANYFTYQSSEMSHSYHPDNQNQTYSFSNGYLEMANSFPNEYHEEDWTSWNNAYNSSYILSSESNGNFSSELNAYSSSSLPTQPMDFTFVNGSFNSTEYGDLNEIDDDYSILNSTEGSAEGHYPATYSFENDTEGGNPGSWAVVEPADTHVNVYYGIDGHSNVTEIYDNSNSDAPEMEDTFSGKATGTIEFWMRMQGTKIGYVYIFDGIKSDAIWLAFASDGNIKYYDTGWNTIMAYSTAQWYHLRVEWDCATDWHLWIDGVSKDGGAGYPYRGTPSAMDAMHFTSDNAETANTYYLDAIGYSWDPDYSIGDNLNETGGEGALNFNCTFAFDGSLIHANETLDNVELEYSLNSSVADLKLNISAWNFDLNRFIALNYSILDGNFYDIVFTLNSSLYNSSYHIILNFNASHAMFFRVNIEMLKINFNWTKTAGFIYSNFSKFISYSFLNKYDAFSSYQKRYNVSVSFQYSFSNYTSYSHGANITINDNSTVYALTVDGSWHEFSHLFEFNSTSESGFWITLNMTNGLLEIVDMNYTLVFNCLDLNDKTRLLQYFKIEPTFSLDQYEKVGNLFINFTHYFEAGDASFNYANNSMLTIKLNLQSEDSIIINYYYYNTSISSSLFSVNVKEILTNHSKNQFLDFSLEIWVSGDESEYHLDNLYLLNDLQRIQLTTNPRTDIDSVEFRDFLVASRDFSYWYFLNTNDINDVDMLNKRTDSLTTSFDEENDRYYFIDPAQDNDIYQSDIDYDPNWDVSYSFSSTGTSTTLTIKYKADMTIENVTLVLDLSGDDLYMEEWNNNATQDEDSFILEIPSLKFTTIQKTIVLKGTSDVPHAEFRRFECQEIALIDSAYALRNYTYKGYLKYDRYSRSYIIDDINSSWELDGVHYGASVMTVDERGYFETKGGAYDSSITSSYLQFKANPIDDFGVFDYGNGTLLIKIDCNLPIQNASVWFGIPSDLRYQLKSSGLTFIAAIGDIAGYDYYYFFYSDLKVGENKIFIEYDIYTVTNLGNYLIVVFMITGGFLGVWYYRERQVIKKAEKTLSEKDLRKFYEERQRRGGLFTMIYRGFTDYFRKKTPAEKARAKKEQLRKKEERKSKRKRIWF